MSLDYARAFIEKMKSDETFRNRFMAIEDVDVGRGGLDRRYGGDGEKDQGGKQRAHG